MNNFIKTLEIGKYGISTVKWDLEHSPNSHAVLVGESGGGKTVMAQKLLCEIAKQGGTAIVFNSRGVLVDDQIHPDLKATFEQYRNDINVFENGMEIPLFDPIVYPDGYVENINDTIGAVADIICRAFKKGMKDRTALRTAIEAVIEENLYHLYGFSAVEDKLRASRNKVSEALAEELHFLFAHNVFRDGNNSFQSGKINFINMSRMDISTQEALTEVVLSHIWRLANADQFKQDKIFVFIDECQNLDHSSKGPLALLISEGRKMGVNLILATQMILQGTTNSVQQRLSQCGLMLIFKPAQNRMGITARLVSNDNANLWASKLSKLRVGEFIAQGTLVLNNRCIAYPLIVDGYIGERDQIDYFEKET